MGGGIGGLGAFNVNTIMNSVDFTTGGVKKDGGTTQIVPDPKEGGAGGGFDATPPGPSEPPAITLTLARIESSSGKASELFNKAMVTQLQEQKKNALDQQLQARQGAKDSLLAAAGQLQKQANDIMSNAIASLVVSVVMDTVSLGLSVAGGVMSAKGIKEENFSKEMDNFGIGGAIKNTSAWTNRGAKFSEGGSMALKLGESASGFASANGQAASKNDESVQKTDEAMAQQFEAQADAAKQRVQDMQDFAGKIIEFIHEIRQSKSEMMAAIVQRG